MAAADIDLLAGLPHRPPFLLLDRALLVEPGRWAVGLKSVSQADALTDGRGDLPAILLAEVMAQTAGLAATDRAGRVAVMAKLNRFRCRDAARCGTQILAVARVVRRFGASTIVHAALRCGGRRWAAAEIVLRFV